MTFSARIRSQWVQFLRRITHEKDLTLLSFINQMNLTQKQKPASFKQRCPNAQSSKEISPRSFFSYNKKIKVNLNLRVKTQRQAELKSQEIYKEIGSPKNLFIKRRIKQFSHNLTNQMNKKFSSSLNQSTLNSTIEQQSYLQSKAWSRQLSSHCHSQNGRISYEKAHTLKEKQKLERIILRRKQQQEDFEVISHKIQFKLKPKKLKVYLDHPESLTNVTWYRNWAQSVVNSKKIKQQKIAMRLRTTQAKRRNTFDCVQMTNSD